MNVKNILVVEDEERMIILTKDALEFWNEANEADERCFEAIFAKSLEGAEREFFFRKIDCALIDLRLPLDDDAEDTDPDIGNSLATEVLLEKGIPVAIISGNTRDADPDLLSYRTVQVFEKADDGHERAVDWLAGQWELMDALRAVRHRLEQSTGEVFARRIWPNWSQMADSIGHDSERLATAIARQYASHTAEFLGQDGDDWHPFETFIVPSYIDDRAHTGDIFSLDDGYWIVLTPQCDMVTSKVPNVLLAKCSLEVKGWEEKLNALRGATSNAQKEKAARFIRNYVNQNLSPSKHFLPPVPGQSRPLLVQFGEIQTMPLDKLNEILDARVAAVSAPFLSNLVQRFGAFISRTGQPNTNIDDL